MTFQLHPDFLQTPSGAQFSDCRKYRYTLWRRWNGARDPRLIPELGRVDPPRAIAFIGLNPSTADETVNDPTITRCINLAKRDGFDGMVMLNLFAFRATDPKDMKAADEPIGEHNWGAIVAAGNACESRVYCWGNHGEFRFISMTMRTIQPKHWNPLCFGKNKSGEPVHPLYQPADAVLIPFNEPDRQARGKLSGSGDER